MEICIPLPLKQLDTLKGQLEEVMKGGVKATEVEDVEIEERAAVEGEAVEGEVLEVEAVEGGQETGDRKWEKILIINQNVVK